MSTASHRLTRVRKQSMPPLYLSRHVYFCLTGEGAVFLDLRRNQYSAIANSQIRTIEAVIVGWPTRTSLASPEESTLGYEQESLVKELLERALLTTEAKFGKPASPTDFPPATETLHDDSAGVERWFRASHLLRFLWACLGASFSLKVSGLEQTVRRISRRTAGVHEMSTSELNRVRELLAIYMRLRPLVFTAKDACLFDSLTLLRFLSMYRMFPTWILGVKTAPFGAHSWLQCGRFVLNGSAEYVRAFTPIMAL